MSIKHIKTENGYSLFLEVKNYDSELYMLKFLTRFSGAKNPEELREINRMFFTRGELEQFVAAVQSAVDEPAQQF
jgi:hypothetical protein